MEEQSDNKSKPLTTRVEESRVSRKKEVEEIQGSNCAGELFRVAFCTVKGGPEPYGNSVKRFVSTQSKNDSGVMKCLLNEKIVKRELHELPENKTAHRVSYG